MSCGLAWVQSLVYSYIHSCPLSLYRSSHSHHSLYCTHQYLKRRKIQLKPTILFTLKHISRTHFESASQNSINPESTLDIYTLLERSSVCKYRHWDGCQANQGGKETILPDCIYKYLCSSLSTYTVGLPQHHEGNKVFVRIKGKNYLLGRIKASGFFMYFRGTIKCRHIKECTICDLS